MEALLDYLLGKFPILHWIRDLPLKPAILVWLVIIALIAMGLYTALGWIGAIRKKWVDEVKPIFFANETELRRREMRRLFARHLVLEIDLLKDREDWSEQRFAELEAEVEVQTRGRNGLFGSVGRGLRREKSLTRAVTKSSERLILAEGEPGSGKSTALRHVAFDLATKAARSRSAHSVLPAYINLKGLNAPVGKCVDAEMVREYVLQVLNRPHDRGVAQVLGEEFDRGLREGTWLFLFDSFDEIPAILSATSVDETVRLYEDAISDFLGGLNVCRGVIASREFRGPRRLSWPRMRILPLSDKRRAELVRASLPKHQARELLRSIAIATPEIASMARNPLFLTLLCEHGAIGRSFPETNYSVFESYFTARFKRDHDRVFTRYGVTDANLRLVAETAAFQMSAHDLGLTPLRAELLRVISEDISFDAAAACLDALEFIKIARSEETENGLRFTFAHRRFQEYFATRIVLASPDSVSATDLLTDARWRETTVVFLQTQPMPALSRLLGTADAILSKQWAGMAPLFDDGVAQAVDEPSELSELSVSSEPREFPWPNTTIHILATLAAGLAGRAEQVPDSLVRLASRIIVAAYQNGTLIDRKIAIEISGLLPPLIVEAMILHALKGKSLLLADVAYQEVSQLPVVSSDVARQIRSTLVRKSVRHELWRERNTVMAHVLRLNDQAGLARTARLLVAVAAIDKVLTLAGILLVLVTADRIGDLLLVFLLILTSFRVGKARTLRALVRARTLVHLLIKWEVAEDLWIFAVAYALRVCVVVIVVLKVSQYSIPFSVAIAVTLSWTPFALLAAYEEQFLAPGWWPLLSFWPLIALVRSAPRMSRQAYAHRHEIGCMCEVVAVVLLLISGFCLIPEKWFDIHVGLAPWLSRILAIIGVVLKVIVFTVLGLFYLLFIVGLVAVAARKLKARGEDKRRLALWRLVQVTSADELLSVLFALSTAAARIALIDDARSSKRIAATRENERRLFAVALAAERTQSGNPQPDIIDSDMDEIWKSAALVDSLYSLVLTLKQDIE